MKSLVELIEYHFGHTLNSVLINSIKRLNDRDDELFDFMERFSDFADNPFIPEREGNELRAFIGFSHSDTDMIFYDVDQNAIDLNYFKRLLLYYDRVALTIHTEFFYEKMGYVEPIVDLVDLVNSIKPLVEKNIINFVSEPVLYNPARSFAASFKSLTGRKLPRDRYDAYGNRLTEPAILADLNACHILDLDYVTTKPSNWSSVR